MREQRSSAVRLFWPALMCACVTGCFDTKQEITLNPDGSGKVVMESTFAQTELLLKESKPTTSEEAATWYVRKLVEEAQGVDAWRDISYRELEDGRLTVRGTAYFRDFSKFRTSLNPFVQFKVTKDAADQLTIALQPDTSQSPIPIPKTNEPVTAESIQYERKQFRAAQPWLAATLGTMKQETTFRFPGVMRQASNLQTTSPQSLRFSHDGARLMKALEDFMRDPEFTLQRLAASSGTNFPQVEFLNEKLYGQRGPVRAVILPGGKPLFDYAAEVAEARKSFSAMAKELGLAEPPVARVKPAVDGATASIRVNGIGWRFDEEKPLRSLSGGLQQGYTLSLRAELPGPVFKVDKIEVTRAATLEGVLLKAKAYFYGAVWIEDAPFLTTNVNFDVYLGSLAVDCKGLAEISGVLECVSAENLRTVELISGRLRAGAKGAQFGAHLDHVGLNDAGNEKLVLRTSLEPRQLRSLKVIDDTGLTVNLDIRRTMNVGKEYTYTCADRRSNPRSGKLVADARQSIPSSGKLVAEVLVGSQSLRIPFSVTNLTLLGQPLAAN